MKSISTLIVGFLLIGNSIHSQTLNEEYGGDGVVSVDVAQDYDQAFDGAVDYMNRSVIMARVYVGADWHMGLFRMTPEGELDSSFDGDGMAEFIDVGISNGMAVGPNGKIVVVGGAIGTDGSVDMVIFRVNEDGSVDDGFGDNGWLSLAITPNTNESALEVFIQEDNKILVGGSNGDFLSAQHIIIRLNEDGSLDDSFANNGVYSPALQSTSEYVGQIEMNSNGDIYYLAETTVGSTDYSGLIVKLNSGGLTDATFGNSGVLNLFEEGYSIDPSSFYLFDDGDIEVTGTINETYYSGCKLRFEANGSADTDYGDNGAVTISGVSDVYTYNSYVQSDGKTVLFGLTTELFFIRLNEDGSIDTSFGTDGWWYPNFTTTYDSAVAAAILSNDEMIVLGSSYTFTADLFFASVLLNDNIAVSELDLQSVTVFPNPALFMFTVDLGTDHYSTMELFSQGGELVWTQKIPNKEGLLEISVPAYMADGIYKLVLKEEDGRSKSTSIVLSK